MEQEAWLEEIWEKLQTKLRAECQRLGSKIPYIAKNGKYEDLSESDLYWWTNGFWPGILWQMYHAAKEECYRTAAEGVEEKFDRALEGYTGLHHDVGFMWLHSAVANYRLTGNERSKERGLHAANILAGRYNPAGRFIRAWNGDCIGWIIIDCLMNIPLLYWASETTADPRFRFVAQEHADTALKYLARPDGSSNHIAVLDPVTGGLAETPGGQGYAPGSSWSRGQAWALYGFALSYRYTEKKEYLDAAKRSAHYLIANVSLTDWIPVIDFRSPAEPVKVDTTAAAIAACGLLELAEQVPELEKPLYQKAALQILRALSSRYCCWDPEKDSIVSHGSGSYHSKDDQEVPIIYADYFFLEAVLRCKGMDFLIW